MFEVSYFDIFYSIILIVIFYLSSKSKSSKINSSCGIYYSKGLLFKLLGSFIFCVIYAFYYGGGDTINYYQGVKAMYSLLWYNPLDYFYVLFSDNDVWSWAKFYEIREYPPTYMFKDDRTFNVIRFSSILSLPGFGGFFATSVVLARVMYSWVWRLYEFVCLRYQGNDKYFAFAILLLPSCVFWGSGIMKDTFTFSAACFFLVGLYEVFVLKKSRVKNLINLFIAFYFIITIKAYILFALLPGALIFLNFERLQRIRNGVVKVLLIPFLISSSVVLIQFVLVDMDEMFGKYSSDRILEEAAIQQQDLQRSVYGENNFDIGTFEPTLQGVLSKAHLAINAAVFRPYIWESNNPVMFLSGLENLIVLLASIYLLIIKGLRNIPKIFGDGFLIFCFLFTILLAFGVGVSTANFGALVRYKIPFIPFYLVLLIVLGVNKK